MRDGKIPQNKEDFIMAKAHFERTKPHVNIARQLLGTGMPASQVALIIKLPLDTVNALHK